MSNVKETVMHIPSIQVLHARPMVYWINQFHDRTGGKPDKVVLPAIGTEGPIFESRVAQYPNFAHGLLLPDLMKQIKDALPDAKIWGSINMCLPFLGVTPTYRVVDNFGVNLDNNMCVVNPQVQYAIKVMIGEMCQYDLGGIVLDCTDLYPQAASDIVKGELQNTCFCPYCRKGLKSHGFHEDITTVFTQGRIHRVALRVGDNGVANIGVDLRPGGDETRAGEELYLQAKARHFFEVDDEHARKDAHTYIDYLRARVNLTVESLNNIGQSAHDLGKKVAVILGEYVLDLTTMCDVHAFQQQNVTAIDEVWAGNENGFPIETLATGVIVKLYLASRATYIFNNLTETLFLADKIFSAGAQQQRNDTIRRLHQKYHYILNRFILANHLGGYNVRPAVFAVEQTNRLDGFVGIPLISLGEGELMWQKMLERNNVDMGSSTGNDDDQRKAWEVLRGLLGSN